MGGRLLNRPFYMCHNGMVRVWEFALYRENLLEGGLSFVCGFFE